MHNRLWIADDLWNLLYLEPKDLRIIYPNHSWDSLKAKRKVYRRKVKKGEIMPPQRSEQYDNPENERLRAAERRKKLATPAGRQALSKTTVIIEVPEETLWMHEKLKQANEEAQQGGGGISKARFSEYQMGYKDEDGEAQAKDLKASRFEVKFEYEPQWPTLEQANAKIVRPAKYERRIAPDGFKTAVILPDPQIGYRRYEDGELDPTHDELAISVALQIVAQLKPEMVICLGDLMDLPEMSTKYIREPEFNHTMQPSILRANEFLATIRASVPDTELIVMEGNHDRRIFTANLANWEANTRLKQANGSRYPVLSVPHLVNFEQLGAKYIEGYPANSMWITDRLKVIHGNKAVSRGSTASAVVGDERVSTIFGHIHRQEVHLKTFDTREGPKIYGAYSPGCLCRIDGAVPSTKGSTDFAGRPITRYENWQQGLAVVEYNPDTGEFNYQNIFINTADDYKTRYNGRTYTPWSTNTPLNTGDPTYG